MRVGLDLTALMEQATGVDRYLLALLEGLAAVDRENRYLVFINREDRERLPPLPRNFEVARASTRQRPVRLGWQQVGLPVVGAARRLDVVHSPSFILPVADRRTRHLLSVHDLTSFSHPRLHEPLRRSWPYKAAVRASVRLAQCISVPTEAVRHELLRRFARLDPARVRVIPYGVSGRFRPEAVERAPAIRRRLGLGSPYLLFVGTIQPRKNLELLLEAYRRLVVGQAIAEDLVIAGKPGWDYERVMTLARTPPLAERVHLLGYVDDRLLPGLYAGARAVVYPSLEEGFGFPPLEAMACGVPVVSTSTPALAENLAGAAELAPADRPEAVASAIARVVGDERLRERLRRDGLALSDRFRWEDVARQTIGCYRELARAG